MRYLLLVLFLAACGPTINVVPIDTTPRPRTTEVEVFASDPDRPFDELAIITVRSASIENARAVILERAKQLGGNAVVLTTEEAAVGAYGFVSTETALVGRVLAWR